MKKLSFFIFSIIVLGLSFQSCSDDKTYAEQMKDEKKAVEAFIRDNNIKVISLGDFEKDTITNVDQNEYVLFPNGVYMQIVDRGEGESAKHRSEVIVRFTEYNISYGVEVVSNLNVSEVPDEFYYFDQDDSSYGLFKQSYLRNYYSSVLGTSLTTGVPVGWLVPLKYVKNLAHVKLIVPHKVGHSYSQQQVQPNFYDLHRIQIY